MHVQAIFVSGYHVQYNIPQSFYLSSDTRSLLKNSIKALSVLLQFPTLETYLMQLTVCCREGRGGSM